MKAGSFILALLQRYGWSQESEGKLSERIGRKANRPRGLGRSEGDSADTLLRYLSPVGQVAGAYLRHGWTLRWADGLGLFVGARCSSIGKEVKTEVPLVDLDCCL